MNWPLPTVAQRRPEVRYAMHRQAVVLPHQVALVLAPDTTQSATQLAGVFVYYCNSSSMQTHSGGIYLAVWTIATRFCME